MLVIGQRCLRLYCATETADNDESSGMAAAEPETMSDGYLVDEPMLLRGVRGHARTLVKSSYRRASVVVASATCLAGGAAVVSLGRRAVSGTPASGSGDTFMKVVLTCAGPLEDCHRTQCCQDGGSGYTCWGKNPYYAQCLPDHNCTREGWSCVKFGGRSKAGCESFDEGQCSEYARCEWVHERCATRCGAFVHADMCPDTHCAWTGTECIPDPCSAPSEDCSTTKCCSTFRHADGMQCYRESKYWATCLDYCDPAEGFDCDSPLGNRTLTTLGCSWSGQDCSRTRSCCNVGHSCAVKDETFTGCVQTAKKSSWYTSKVPMPADWEGRVLGGSRNEFAIQPAPPQGQVMGTSMFCFMAVLPNTAEEALMKVSQARGHSIFACNASAVFHSWRSDSADWDTGARTLINTDVFINIWEQVRYDGRYLRYDWTVKVDADCAFMPDRLRSHLWQLRPPAGAQMYLKNTAADPGMMNGGFLGAIEVFSRKAIRLYFDHGMPGCKDTIGLLSGEDGFFKGCMDALGVGYMHDGNIMKPDSSASFCQNGQYVAFHPIKCPESLSLCYDFAEGKQVTDWSHNTCR